MAYYSKLRPEVYHICKNCTVGNNMVKGNLRKRKPKPVKGRDGKTRKLRVCETCKALKKAGKCTPGVPILPRPYKYAAVMAYYSAEHPEIYHVCQNCYLGQNIEFKYLRQGKPRPAKGRDGKTRKPRVCKICARLCSAGESIPGAPIPAGGRKLTKAYYSTAYPRPKIFHVCQHCYIGKRIKQQYLRKGRPKNAKLCANCVRMCVTGECVLGAP
jgi:hypothetical protein